MVKNMRHIGIVVKDLKSSLHFYRDLLGFRIVKQNKEEGEYLDRILALQGGKATTVKLALPKKNGTMIELLEFHLGLKAKKAAKVYDQGLTHFALTVDDLEKEYKRLKGKGVFFNSPPQRSPDGYAKVAFCRAPEGTFIELVEV